LLLPLLLAGSPLCALAMSSADYFVHSLPGQPEGPLLKMHAGHVEVDPDNNGNIFFWHFQNRHIANRQRTVIWLNGGPGCSSMDGALMEIGPYRLKDDHTLEYNNGSWDEFANLLFVDQPVGTGFSYVNTNSYLHELSDVAAQFITFLEKWLQLFPEYEHDDIYLAGESYAGQYIPYFAKAILERNQKMSSPSGTEWSLKGLLIGNGWISPWEQYQSYLPFAYKENLLVKGSKISQELEGLQSICVNSLNAPDARDKVEIPECEHILAEFHRLTQDSSHQCYNMYDVRLRDEFPSCGMNWPPDLADITPYLQRNDVMNSLHINPDKSTGWEECSGAVGSNLITKESVPSIQFLPALLESGIPILLFSGNKDHICNHIGTEQLIHNLKWNGGAGFETSPGVWAPRRDWTFEGEPAGYYQQARNLTYVLFYNASHMVPFDVSRRTRDMLDRFMHVDITSIGGTPADSRIDGEKLPQTSVGGNSNSTAAEEQELEKLKEAEWKAYAKSGEAVLAIVIIAVAIWGFFMWRNRRRRRGYRSIYENGSPSNDASQEQFRTKRSRRPDIEAGRYDEAELDRLNTVARPEDERDHYALGEDSDDERQSTEKRARNGLEHS